MIDVLKKDGIRFKKGDRVYHKNTPQYQGTVRKGNYLGYGCLDVILDSGKTICYDIKDVIKVSKISKTEEVLRACCEIEIDLDNKRAKQAEGKLMNLCGILAKGTKYQSEIDRLGELYLKVWKKGEREKISSTSY